MKKIKQEDGVSETASGKFTVRYGGVTLGTFENKADADTVRVAAINRKFNYPTTTRTGLQRYIDTFMKSKGIKKTGPGKQKVTSR